MENQKRPCDTCMFSFEAHKEYKDMEHIFCPDQNLLEGPAEVFDCYIPCGNLKYLEWLEKQRKANNG